MQDEHRGKILFYRVISSGGSPERTVKGESELCFDNCRGSLDQGEVMILIMSFHCSYQNSSHYHQQQVDSGASWVS